MRNINARMILLHVFLFTSYSYGQTVSTFVPAGSGIDEALFRSSSGVLYGNGWVTSALYAFNGGVSTLITDTLQNGSEICETSTGDIIFCDNQGDKIFKYKPASGAISIMTSSIITPSGLLKMP